MQNLGVFNRLGLPVARKWIGGITIDEVIKESHRLNHLVERVMINYLGEDLIDDEKIVKNVDTYIKLLAQMHKNRIKGCIAIKPTQLGLKVRYSLFLQNYHKVVAKAKSSSIFVWLDMEEHQYVDATITAYLETLQKYKNVGICLQAKLKRTFNDTKLIGSKGGAIRLVKGAYKNHPGITFKSEADIEETYKKCMYYLFNHSKYFMIATHDDKLIDTAIAYQKKYKRKAMFGMLKGIRPSLSLKLARAKEEIYIYVPFGEDWIAYSLRRLKEKEHSMMVLRSIFQG